MWVLRDLARRDCVVGPDLVLWLVLVETAGLAAVEACERTCGDAVEQNAQQHREQDDPMTTLPSAAGRSSSAMRPNTIEASPRGPNHPMKATVSRFSPAPLKRARPEPCAPS